MKETKRLADFTFRHWASKPLALDRTRQYPVDANHFKPLGLWFDADSDWKRWCESEGFMPNCLTVPHIVTLKPGANILLINSPEALEDFTVKWGGKGGKTSFRETDFIRWLNLRTRYDGIVIAPYQWSKRLSLEWYYSWDCASGCVWDLSAIESFEVEAERIECH